MAYTDHDFRSPQLPLPRVFLSAFYTQFQCYNGPNHRLYEGRVIYLDRGGIDGILHH